MTRDQVLENLCQTVALVYRTLDDYSAPSDGFCHKCPASRHEDWTFQHSGQTLDYVRQAVIEKLEKDGYKPRLDVLES